MRIALYLSGRVNCGDVFLKRLSEYKGKVDVFLSVNGKYDEKLIELYNPVMYSFEEYKLPEGQLYITKNEFTTPYNMYSQFYNNLKCMEMIEGYQDDHKFKYDIIIKFRSDIVSDRSFFDFIPYGGEQSSTIIPKSVDDNVLYIPRIFQHTGMNDQVAFGNGDVMRKYSALYKNLKKYVIDEGRTLHPESNLKYHIEKCGIKIEYFDYHYELHHNRKN